MVRERRFDDNRSQEGGGAPLLARPVARVLAAGRIRPAGGGRGVPGRAGSGSARTNPADDTNPERLLRKTFLARPRIEGLWVRLTLLDGDQIEGLAPLDAALADGFTEDFGIHLVPPDARGNTQRLYVPRSAMHAMQVVAVVTTPSRRKTTVQFAVTAGADDPQLALALQQNTPAE